MGQGGEVLRQQEWESPGSQMQNPQPGRPTPAETSMDRLAEVAAPVQNLCRGPALLVAG